VVTQHVASRPGDQDGELFDQFSRLEIVEDQSPAVSKRTAIEDRQA
jgi:hypothetical protein